MKKFLLVLQFLFFISYCSFSQGIGIGNNNPDPSAVLDITNTSKGLLIPRMNTTAINVIASPAKGLLVYDSSTNQLMANVGTTVAPHWLAVASNNNAWNLSGNNNTNPVVQFLGTIDNKPLRFRVNNIQAGELDAATGSVSLGLRSGQNNATGFNNIAIGKDALRSNKAGFGLVAIGDSALFNNDNDNPSPGIFATSNTAVGSKALFSNDFGSNNTATGSNALSTNTHGNLNSAYGASSLSSNINGGFNTAIGGNALSSNTIGNFNTSIGAMSLLFNFNGHNNTATGVFSLTVNTSGNDNTAAGVRSLTSNTTGNFNSAFGSQSMFFNQTGNGNTAIGDSSLLFNTTGNGNTASGFRALGLNKDGQDNTAIGNNALNSAFHSSNNTAIGVDAGSGFVLGSGNTLIGAGADVGGDNIFNAVAIGKGARCTGNNQVRLGNTFTTSIGAVVGFTNISDGRFKKNIQESVIGIDFIMKLRPVTYQLDIAGLNKKLNVNGKINTRLGNGMNENAQTIFSGFIAQEVENAARATGYDFSGVDKPKNENDIYGLRYAEFVVPLVKAIQEQQQMILELKKQNTDLLNRILILEKFKK